MKKITFLTALFFATVLKVLAQEGSNQIVLAVELGFPIGDLHKLSAFGVGGSVKGLLGVSPNGHLTYTTGILVLGGKREVERVLGNVNIIEVPLLAGYRHSFGGFNLEPQVGYGFYLSELISTKSFFPGGFTWAMGLGFSQINGVDVGARFQSGIIEGTSTNLIALHLGYRFNAKSKKKK